MSSIIEYAKDNCPPHVTMGKHSYCFGEFRGSMNKVIIGAFCSIAQGVVFDSGFQHDLNRASTFPFKTRMRGCGHVSSNVVCRGDIKIGNDVWIGENAMIMSGVIIGNGAVIGAGSIVTKSVHDYEIVAGNPAKSIRPRCSYNDALKMCKIAWWDWPDEKIIANAHIIGERNIREIIEEFYEG